ncbi:hypothetical protein PENTCL1PPCAC_27137 [Pristionchus entomophagus]|uniref:Calpain catalytic domain-containing protein n=1 Tax=Pristionchus entomophagus TaxID=358040 RepID=A0AAV5UEZ5_9BILA|nr:hypothetical protein PENTCL1PPCAC_27137 [Pristionchus entomophagus]
MSDANGGRIGSSKFFGGQNYNKLRKDCEKKKALFVDTVFPPSNYSLFLEEGRHTDIEWKRPAEIADDPHLFVEGASPNDVTQGILGNCWFVSACSALTHNQKLLEKVIPLPDDQEWSGKRRYCGIFRFCFWRFGRWIEIVIDDLLPTRDGKLLFARSKTNNEFWSALLEKAFAKLYGCYENLVGGRLSDALQDVSGGVAETINTRKYMEKDAASASTTLFDHVKTSFDNGALIVAAIAARTKEEIEMSLDCGLVKGHAYAVTAVRFIELSKQKESIGAKIGAFFTGHHDREMLIRLQNPWGEKEWNGPWSDGSKEWELVSEAHKRELGITVDEDGEFWMPWNSFVEQFTDISLCQLFNTSHFSVSKRFHEDIHYGEWTTNGSKSGAPNDLAGGCLNFTATCCSNPQFLLEVTTPQNEMYFSLTQKEINEGLKRREPHISIGMHLMRVERNRKFRVHQPMEGAATSDYSNSRSVCLTVRDLAPGRYILMPTTFAPREQTTFLLRGYGDFHFKLTPLTKHAPRSGILSCNSSPPSVTRLQIRKAEYHRRPNDSLDNGLKFYCIIKSEKEKCQTSVQGGSMTPEWNDLFLFHRKDRRQQYFIELWHERFGPDVLIARAELVALMDNECKEVDLPLVPPKSKSTSESVGTISIQMCAYDDPYYI